MVFFKDKKKDTCFFFSKNTRGIFFCFAKKKCSETRVFFGTFQENKIKNFFFQLAHKNTLSSSPPKKKSKMAREVGSENLMQMYSTIFERRIRKFPGALPTTTTQKNKILLHYGFLATLKADGDRCFAIVNNDVLILHRRDGAITTFSLPTSFKLFVFDCEYVVSSNLLLIFDTLIYAEHAAHRLSLEQRSELANHFLSRIVPKDQRHVYANSIVDLPEVVSPIPTSYCAKVTWHIANGGPKVQNKPWYDFHDAAKLWEYRQMVPYATDGVIFNRLLCTYSPFSENPEAAFKWKPTVTIDFCMVVITDPTHDNLECDRDVVCAVDDADRDHMTDFLHPSDERRANYRLFTCNEHSEFLCVSRIHLHEDTQREHHRKVGEFYWDKTKRRWRLERVRHDKQLPNNFTTTLSSLHSILDNLQIDDLISK